MNEPLTPAAAKALIITILEAGTVSFTQHALDEMAADKLTNADVIAVLRGGVVEPAEFERGSWRYRVRTSAAYAVVAFRSESWTVVVTAWRRKR